MWQTVWANSKTTLSVPTPYVYRFWSNMCQHPGDVYFKEGLAYFSNTMANSWLAVQTHTTREALNWCPVKIYICISSTNRKTFVSTTKAICLLSSQIKAVLLKTEVMQHNEQIYFLPISNFSIWTFVRLSLYNFQIYQIYLSSVPTYLKTGF